MIPGISSAVTRGPERASITFVDDSSNATSASVYTFTDHATGTAGNRWTIVGIAAVDSDVDFHTSGVTVGGVAATEIIDSANASSVQQSSLYIIYNPAGTTATIEVTMSETVLDCAISVWAAYDLQSPTAVDTASVFLDGTTDLTLSLDIPAEGIAVAMAGIRDSGSTADWTGLTERSDAVVGVLNYTSADSSTAGTPLAVTVNFSQSQHSTGVSASFR